MSTAERRLRSVARRCSLGTRDALSWLGARRKRIAWSAASLALLTGLALSADALRHAHLIAPDPTLLLEDRGGRFLGEIPAGGRDAELGFWPVEPPPPRVVAATLAVEDHRFYSHPGVDPIAIGRALLQNLRSGERVSGASTLAMQIARMQSRADRRTYSRKLREALTAIVLTARFGRERILEHYLRIAPYGNRFHGIAFAARRYFDKPVADLSWAETAFLVAIPQSPALMNPLEPRGRARAIARGRRILDLLAANGQLAPEQAAVAREEIARLHVPPKAERPPSALHTLLRLEQTLRQPESWRQLRQRPLVRTSIDLERQREVEWLLERAVHRWEPQGAGNAAALVVELATGEVTAAVGSTDYFDESHAGAIDYTRVERSPGSTLKPFVYARALERGLITPATVLDDLRSLSDGIRNADHRDLGPLLPRQALANSRNVPAFNLARDLGVDDLYAFLEHLGLHDGSVPAAHYGAGMALGTLPTTLERLVRAYTALANDGVLQELIWYQGQAIERRRVLSEATARQITLFLSDPMARLPSFPRMGSTEYPFAVAAKTGTSSQLRDAWAVVYSKRYLVGVWVGHPDYRPMYRLSGFASAAELAQQILLRLQPRQTVGLDDVGFAPPRDAVAMRICALSGKLATAACDHVIREQFVPGQEPVARCDLHVAASIDRRNGLLASARTPVAEREQRTFVRLPPRYASWARTEGLVPPPRAVSRLGTTGDPEPLPPPAPRLATSRAPRQLHLSSPTDQLHLLRDPESPPSRDTLGLEVEVDPPAEQVLWYVDGQPYRLADYPYSLRWPLEPGEHTFQARVPYRDERSRLVRVRVD